MNKKIDVSVLPDGFLIEVPSRGISGAHAWSIKRMNSLARTYAGFGDYRPALDIWHFNNGLMVLPDGLVIEAYHLDDFKYKTCTPYRLERDFEDPLDATIAVKIIGVTPEYGAQLGMEVIEL